MGKAKAAKQSNEATALQADDDPRSPELADLHAALALAGVELVGPSANDAVAAALRVTQDAIDQAIAEISALSGSVDSTTKIIVAIAGHLEARDLMVADKPIDEIVILAIDGLLDERKEMVEIIRELRAQLAGDDADPSEAPLRASAFDTAELSPEEIWDRLQGGPTFLMLGNKSGRLQELAPIELTGEQWKRHDGTRFALGSTIDVKGLGLSGPLELSHVAVRGADISEGVLRVAELATSMTLRPGQHIELRPGAIIL